MQKNIKVERQGNGITTITLNRPEVYNSLNKETCTELIHAFHLCYTDPTKVIVLTGTGKGFSSGQDLNEILLQPDLTPSELMKVTYNPLISAMRRLPKPIICRLNGVAAGAGCSLALACDFIIASEEAVLTEAFIGIGLVPDSGSSYFLPKLMGRLKAFELLSMGSKITASEAERLGMINKMVPAANLDQATEAVVQQYLHSPLVAVGLIKQMVNQSYHQNLEEALQMEAKFQDQAASTKDFKEGVAAFKEKRKPTFTGA